MADRRSGSTKGIPHVRTASGDLAPRSRRQDGAWRRKRSDAGKPRPKRGGPGRGWSVLDLLRG